MKKYWFALFLFPIVFLFGCGKTGDTAPPNYFPLVNGYQWQYHAKLLIGTVESQSTNETRTVNGTSQLTGSLTVINLIVSHESGSSDILYYSADETGIYQYGSAAHPTLEATQILAFPLTPGKSWKQSSLLLQAIGEEKVTVPAGTFEAMKVMDTNGDIIAWYTDGVGLVKYSVEDITITTIEAGTGNMINVSANYTSELVSKNF